MLEKTNAFILKSFKHKDNSNIIHAYTASRGRLTFLIHTPKPGKKILTYKSILQPLTQVQIIYYFKPNREMQLIKEIKCNEPYQSIPFDIKKSAVALFLAEILIKCLQEEVRNEQIFHFIKMSLNTFDSELQPIHNFHLIFLFKLTKYLGFYPNYNRSDQNKYFDLQLGEFTNNHLSTSCLNEEYSTYLNNLFNISLENPSSILLTRKKRNHLLNCLLRYYNIHLTHVTTIKSLPILMELFN